MQIQNIKKTKSRQITDLSSMKRSLTIMYLIQLIRTTNSRIFTTNFCLFTFSIFKVLQSFFYIFSITSFIGFFLVYFDLNGELIACQNTQKINKQKFQFRCKNLGFVFGSKCYSGLNASWVKCHPPSWTRYISNSSDGFTNFL